MDCEQIDLHDAILKKMAVDYVAKSVSISVDLYRDKNVPGRIPAIIVFDEVDSLSHITDIKELKEHTFAGHISYWKPAKANETTFIYLTAGCIAITAGKISITQET